MHQLGYINDNIHEHKNIIAYNLFLTFGGVLESAVSHDFTRANKSGTGLSDDCGSLG